MQTRIIGGIFRGRKIRCPKGRTTRPTLAQVREAVFSICQADIAEARFLDLFAGSGAMGIEAISRGAEKATFVDNHPAALRCIQENLRLLDISVPSQAEICGGEVLRVLQKLSKQNLSYDLIYIDPPYGLEGRGGELAVHEVLEQLVKGALLLPTTRIFVEESAGSGVEEVEMEGLTCKKERAFGSTKLLEYRVC